MKVKAIEMGWYNKTLQYPADPDAGREVADVFEIPDEPKHNQDRCKVCQRAKKTPKGEEPEACPKVGLPEAFSVAWMEEVPANTPISERNKRMTMFGGELAFAAAARPRTKIEIGQNMVDGRKAF